VNSFLFELLFLLSFPLLVAATASLLTWNALSRPWLFFLATALVLYCMYVLSMWLLAPASVGWTISYRTPGEPVEPHPWLPLLAPYKVPLLAFGVAALPAIAALLRRFRK